MSDADIDMAREMIDSKERFFIFTNKGWKENLIELIAGIIYFLMLISVITTFILACNIEILGRWIDKLL